MGATNSEFAKANGPMCMVMDWKRVVKKNAGLRRVTKNSNCSKFQQLKRWCVNGCKQCMAIVLAIRLVRTRPCSGPPKLAPCPNGWTT
jgi:hypothetical protein